ITRGEWREIKPEFKQPQNGNGFVFPMINITFARQRRNDDSRDSSTSAPTVASHGRRNVVPTTAILIVRYDDRASVPDVAVLHSAHDIRDVLLPSDDVGIARMFVVYSRKLDK